MSDRARVPPSPPLAVDVVVTGLVQGVFFRASCEQRATGLGVSGWVRNESDDSVRGHFEGTRDSVDALVAWCRRGPAGALVERVEVTESRATGAHGFAVS